MTLESLAAPGERVAVYGSTPRFESGLRSAIGLRGPAAGAPARPRVAYCGYDFRSYGWMSVGSASAFFERLAPVNAALLRDYLAVAGLEAAHDTQRMKTSYRRALVLAIQASLEPELVIVERAQQFDEARPSALLREVVLRAPRAVVTYEDTAIHEQLFTRVLDLRPAGSLA